MSQEKLRRLLETSDADPAWVDDMARRYPFFSLPRAIAGRRLPGVDSQLDMLRLALTTHGADALQHLTGEADTRFDNFYPPAKKVQTPSTTRAIDDFLERYGNQSDEENALLERMIFNPVPDYAQQLAREADEDLPQAVETADDSHDARINRFILAEHRRQHVPSPVADEPPHPKPAPKPGHHVAVDKPQPQAEQSLLSESLAKIYIKTRKYERAYEILSRLSLEFPEKSAYFADQLRFLKKLIVNEKYRNVTNQGQSGSKNDIK